MHSSKITCYEAKNDLRLISPGSGIIFIFISISWIVMSNGQMFSLPNYFMINISMIEIIIIDIFSPVIWIVMSNARMRSVTNYFIINLSMADIINATFNVIPNFTYMLTGNWPFGEIFQGLVWLVGWLV